jgi:hypothetical protein
MHVFSGAAPKSGDLQATVTFDKGLTEGLDRKALRECKSRRFDIIVPCTFSFPGRPNLVLWVPLPSHVHLANRYRLATLRNVADTIQI